VRAGRGEGEGGGGRKEGREEEEEEVLAMRSCDAAAMRTRILRNN